MWRRRVSGRRLRRRGQRQLDTTRQQPPPVAGKGTRGGWAQLDSSPLQLRGRGPRRRRGIGVTGAAWAVAAEQDAAPLLSVMSRNTPAQADVVTVALLRSP